MYKALLDKVSRGRNLPPVWAAFFMAGETPGEMEAICSSFLPLLILCRPLVVALGAGLGVWGVVNLLEGYGSDNPGSNAHVR